MQDKRTIHPKKKKSNNNNHSYKAGSSIIEYHNTEYIIKLIFRCNSDI